MIKFGPSGFCDDFLKKYSHSEEIPDWLIENGLFQDFLFFSSFFAKI